MAGVCVPEGTRAEVISNCLTITEWGAFGVTACMTLMYNNEQEPRTVYDIHHTGW